MLHFFAFILNAQELNQAETQWIKTTELEFLESQRGTFLPVYVTQLGWFLDDQGKIRCKRRVNNSSHSQPSNTPVLLPSKQHLARLIIQDVNSKIKHSGIKDTLTTIRDTFWIPRGREAVIRILRKCRHLQKSRRGSLHTTGSARFTNGTSVLRPTICPHRVRFHRPIVHTRGNVSVREEFKQSVYLLIHVRLYKSNPSGINTISERRIISAGLSEVRKLKGSTSHPDV